MYQINLCSPIWDQTPVSGFNVRVVRILLLTVLLLLYIMYLVINLILRKSVENLKNEDSEQRLYDKQTHMQNWQRQYMLMFGDHVIAVGFVICFSPFQFQILLSMLYFILRCVYEILSQKYNIIIKPIKTSKYDRYHSIEDNQFKFICMCECGSLEDFTSGGQQNMQGY